MSGHASLQDTEASVLVALKDWDLLDPPPMDSDCLSIFLFCFCLLAGSGAELRTLENGAKRDFWVEGGR